MVVVVVVVVVVIELVVMMVMGLLVLVWGVGEAGFGLTWIPFILKLVVKLFCDVKTVMSA